MTIANEGREHGPADRYREYDVVVRDDAGTNYRGFGLTLPRVIAEVLEEYRHRHAAWKAAGRESEEEFVRGEPDRAVWNRDYRVLCVLRPAPGGSLDTLIPVSVLTDWRFDLPPREPTTRGELIRRSTIRAISRYRDAVRWARLSERLDDGRGGHSTPWATLANYQQTDAEKELIRVIFCWDEAARESDILRAERRRWKARGVKLGGRIYLAVPDDDRDGDEEDGEESKTWVMRLVVVEESRLAGVEVSEIVELDRPGDEEIA